MKRRILSGVVGAHLLLLGVLALLGRESTPTLRKRAPLVVHTVKPLPPPQTNTSPRPQSKPTAKRARPKPKAQRSSKKQLLEEAAKQLASITPTKETPPLSPTQPKLSLPSPSRSYGNELAYYLKTALQLPEYGSVKIELELAKDGSITALRILRSHNPQNQAYVQSTLPTLHLPLPDKAQTLTLTLTNS